MTTPNRFVCRSLGFIIVLATAASRPALAQPQPAAREGITVVFLVDVSLSMTNHPDPNGVWIQGNDLHQIRWDAVLLAMNLLTSEDRVAIVPFNHSVPATVLVQVNRPPANLPQRLIDARSNEGREMQNQVRGFIPAVHDPPQTTDGYPDSGGTALLWALTKGSEILRGAEPDRRRFVILLTDGKEDCPLQSKPPELASIPSDQIYANDRFRNWLRERYGDPGSPNPKQKTTVYTIGLGNEQNVDGNLLGVIAQQTGGSYRHLSNNGELIDHFRTLVWQLKGCWTKTQRIAPRAAGQEDDLMSSIGDFGALSYQIVPTEPPRIYQKCAPVDEPARTWKDRYGRPIADRLPTFAANEESSYTYYSFDRVGFDGRESVVSSWSPSVAERELRFAKRTIRPLFKIAEGMNRSFQRRELMRIAVEMDQNLGFQPAQFKLSAKMYAVGGQRNQSLTAELPFKIETRSGIFVCDVNLSALKSNGGQTDTYTVAIEAKGVSTESGDHSLRGYTLEIPDFDIRVESWLELKADPAGLVTLSNENAANGNRITIMPKSPFRVSGDMPPLVLQVRTTAKPTDSQGRGVDILDIPGAVSLSANRSKDNAFEGEIAIGVRNQLPRGMYGGGQLTISGDPATVPLVIPFQVAIEAVKVGFDRQAPIDLKEFITGAPVASQPIQVTRKGKGEPLGNEATVTVAIPRSFSTFGDTELWLQRSDQQRGRELTLAGPADTFQVFFQPKENLKLAGYYPFELGLNVSGVDVEYNPSDGRVGLSYAAPKLVLPTKVTPWRIQSGGAPINRSIPVALKGRDGVVRNVGFQFQPKGPSRIKLDPLGTLQLRASDKPEPKPMWFKLTLPSEITYGPHDLHGQFTAELIAPLNLELQVIVGDLELTDLDDSPLKLPLAFYRLRDRPLVRQIRVFPLAKDDKLDPSRIRVSEEEPFVNLDKGGKTTDFHLKLVNSAACKSKGGRAGVELSLELTGSETSFDRCSGSVAIHCEDVELRKVLPCKVALVDLLAPQEPVRATQPKP